MPTLYAKLTLKQYDTTGAKGEELDALVESEIESIDIEGYDVDAVVERTVKTQAKLVKDEAEHFASCISHFGVDEKDNPYFEHDKNFLQKILNILQGKEK